MATYGKGLHPASQHGGGITRRERLIAAILGRSYSGEAVNALARASPHLSDCLRKASSPNASNYRLGLASSTQALEDTSKP